MAEPSRGASSVPILSSGSYFDSNIPPANLAHDLLVLVVPLPDQLGHLDLDGLRLPRLDPRLPLPRVIRRHPSLGVNNNIKDIMKLSPESHHFIIEPLARDGGGSPVSAAGPRPPPLGALNLLLEKLISSATLVFSGPYHQLCHGEVILFLPGELVLSISDLLF